MKKIFFSVCALAASVLTFSSCDKQDKNDPENPSVSFEKAQFFEAIGTNTVPNVEGVSHDQPFIMDSVHVETVIVTDTTLDIKLYGISFSSKMPVRIDMVIPSARYTRTSTQITISGENIIPTMGGNPFDRYVITGLTGTLTADSLNFSNSYGSYDGCTYAGKIKKMQ